MWGMTLANWLISPETLYLHRYQDTGTHHWLMRRIQWETTLKSPAPNTLCAPCTQQRSFLLLCHLLHKLTEEFSKNVSLHFFFLKRPTMFPQLRSIARKPQVQPEGTCKEIVAHVLQPVIKPEYSWTVLIFI